ncbi:MAG: redox-sensing transcriptional repressor Rex [Gemmatimonadetes bacterium]|nr:redox-sensing transcriptional repressor Rex [Gemmatimonadota bacterium]
MKTIADATVRRLSLYLRFLEDFRHEGASTVSSGALAAKGGTTSAQVRKDLSFFGSFGKRGLGYPVNQLIKRLRDILGLGRRYRVVVVGAGKIGNALIQYPGFGERGFDIVAIFDNDPAKIGQQWNDLTVRDAAHLERDCGQLEPDIGVIVTPGEVAQQIADRLVKAGLTAILNFTPVQLTVPARVTVKGVNLVLELEALSFALASK